MVSSGVPVVFQTCETLVLGDRFQVSGLCVFPKESLKWEWKQDGKWDAGGCSDTFLVVDILALC